MNLHNEEDFYSNREEEQILNRVEKMLNNGEIYYFDVSEFVEILDVYLDFNNLKKAGIVVEIAISQHPHSSELQLKQAQIYVEKKKYSQAKLILQKLIKLETNNPDIFFLLGIIALNQLEINKATAFFNSALEHNSEEKVEMLLNIAIQYENIKKFEEAVEFLNRAYNIQPSNLDVIYEMAFVFEILEKPEKSIKYYKEYLDLFPFAENAWYNIALLYDKINMLDKAIEAFDFAIAIDDSFVQVLYGKANCLANHDKYREAIEVFKETITVDSDNDEIQYSIGECYEKLEEYDSALKHYKNALELNPDNANAWFGIGIIRYYKDELFESLFYVKKALKLNPDDPEYWKTLGKINEKLDFFEDAEIAYKKVVKLDPKHDNSWIKYAEILYKQNKLDEAISALTNANTKIENNPEIIFQLSAYLLESKNYQKAIQYFKLGLSLNYDLHKKFFFIDSKKTYPSTINKLIKKNLKSK